MNFQKHLPELRKFFTDYEFAEQTALSLEWQKTEILWEEWNLKPPAGCHYLLLTFPEGYIQNHFLSALMQCLLTEENCYEGYQLDGSDMEHRRKLLQSGIREDYGYQELRLKEVSAPAILKHFESYLPCYFRRGKFYDIPFLKQFLPEASCIELGGYWVSDHEYLCIEHNRMLLLACGIWD
ncbi:MAG: hypothetical protein IJ644_07420 [Oscillospiraceae bacterium]|nr:hypothetical protein [Oscillospiraceae bacterium]